MGLQPKVYYFYAFRKEKVLKRFIGLVFIFIMSVSTAYTPPKVDTNAKIKAVFIYNFTKYIEWPSEYRSGEFTIGILGDNQSLFNELTKMSKVKKVANQSFSIKSYTDVAQINKPHILYIPKDKALELSKAVQKLKGKSTLIVTEKPGLAKKGSAINFIIVGNRQKFELNKATAEQHKLKVASTLENLAVMVN